MSVPRSHSLKDLVKEVKHRMSTSHAHPQEKGRDGDKDEVHGAQESNENENENVNGSEQADEDHNALHTSDSEGLSEQLEVIFNQQNDKRRRASLVEGDGDRNREHEKSSRTPRPQSTRKRTSCFVHSMLEERFRSGTKANAQAPNMIPEDLYRPADKQSSPGTPDGQHHTQSRLLTKKQLSDMAFGIRELSKKLSRVRLLLDVRQVHILTKAHDQKLIAKTRDVAEWLLKQRNSEGKTYTVWVETTMQSNKAFDAESLLSQDPSYKDRLKFWTNDLCAKKPHTFDICLALGGDGTVLYASWLFQRVVPPVMSFALGSLGFLTKFDFNQYPNTLTRGFTEGITVSLRLRFEATIMRSTAREDEDEQKSRDLVDELIGTASDDINTHRPAGTNNILNDIVIDRGPNPTMSSIEVFGDEEHFTTVQADGICVATPTGSTAYNLAAGGSLCHPDNPVILVTAIAPHTLSFRPIILPDTIVLRIGVPYDARASCWASFDGKERSELKPGDYVTISASRFPFPSVLPLDRRTEDWVDSISRTLNWNNRQRQKAYDDDKDENEK